MDPKDGEVLESYWVVSRYSQAEKKRKRKRKKEERRKTSEELEERELPGQANAEYLLYLYLLKSWCTAYGIVPSDIAVPSHHPTAQPTYLSLLILFF